MKTSCEISDVSTECKCCMEYPKCNCPRPVKLTPATDEPANEIERMKRAVFEAALLRDEPLPKRKPAPTNYTPPKKKRKKKGRRK